MSKTPSRQRLWQLSMKAAGCCTQCGKPADGRTVCGPCAHRRGARRLRPAKSAWRTVDWSQSNAAIALRFGVTAESVRYQRQKHASSLS